MSDAPEDENVVLPEGWDQTTCPCESGKDFHACHGAPDYLEQP